MTKSKFVVSQADSWLLSDWSCHIPAQFSYFSFRQRFACGTTAQIAIVHLIKLEYTRQKCQHHSHVAP